MPPVDMFTKERLTVTKGEGTGKYSHKPNTTMTSDYLKTMNIVYALARTGPRLLRDVNFYSRLGVIYELKPRKHNNKKLT